jgi:hypothetical protein
MLARVTGATAKRLDRRAKRAAMRLEAVIERSSPAPVVGAVTLLATLAWGHYTGRIDTWLVQTDELQFVRLAMEIADSHSLDPMLRGQDIAAWNQLYPLLLAPLYGSLDTLNAFKAAHWLNAFLMASTAIPAYLLARAVDVSKLAGYFVAALSVCVPWIALGEMLRDDAVAYPAFVWAVFAMQRALAGPTPTREGLAFVAIAVAAFARTQFLILGPAFIAAAVLHEGLSAFLERRHVRRADLIDLLRRHWVLAAAAALGVLFGALRGFYSILGSYSSTASGDLIPPGFASNVAMHLSMVALGIGVLPVTLGFGWAVGSLVRPQSSRRHAWASLALVSAMTVTFAASSFVLRNAGTNAFDRYFFYLAPVAFVAMAICIEEGRRRWWLAAVTALGFGWIAKHGAWTPAPPPYHQSPVSAFNSVLDFHANRIGLSGAQAVRWGGMAVALIGAAALRLVPSRVLLPVLCGGLLLFGAAETRSVMRSMLGSQLGVSAQYVGPGYERAWIDAAVPEGAGVALLPELPIELPPGNMNVHALTSTTLWWDTEFWNKRVKDVYVLDSDPHADPTPFPKRLMTVEPRSGRIDVEGVAPSALQPYVVMDAQRSDFRPIGETVRRTTWGLELIRAERPYRTPWAVLGLAPGDRVYPGKPVRVRLFEKGVAKVTLSVMAPYQTTPEPVEHRLTLTGGGDRVRRTLSSGEVGDLSVCLAGRGDTAVLTLLPSPDSDESVRLARTLVEPSRNRASC